MAKTVAIETREAGRLTWTEFNRRVKAAGSQAALARELNVADSTVRNWGLKLRTLRVN